jgi:hypothetical protein
MSFPLEVMRLYPQKNSIYFYLNKQKIKKFDVKMISLGWKKIVLNIQFSIFSCSFLKSAIKNLFKSFREIFSRVYFSRLLQIKYFDFLFEKKSSEILQALVKLRSKSLLRNI